MGCFQCAAVKSSADTFFFSFDSRLSLIATSKVSGDISIAWLVFLHLDARLRFVALRDISQGLERDRCFLHGMCVWGQACSEISRVKEWSYLMLSLASTLIPFLKDFASNMNQILTIAKLCLHQFTRLRSIGFKCSSVISNDFAGSPATGKFRVL